MSSGARSESVALLAARDVSRTFRDRTGAAHVDAVRQASLQLGRGRFVLVRGRSGSGKTTLLNLLGGLDSPTSGKVLASGRDLSLFSERERNRWRRSEVAFVFQALALLPGLTASENVEVMLRTAGWRPRSAAVRARDELLRVGLGTRALHRTYELSGGEQQRVAVARAMAKGPALLIADEPTGELDSATSALVLGVIRGAVDASNMTALVASHDPGAGDYADDIYTMEDGRLEQVRAA